MTFMLLFPERPKSLGSHPSKRQAYQKRLRAAAQQEFARPMLKGELYVRITWFYRNEADGDVDNIVKPILDAFKGLLYEDDRDVVKCVSEKCEIQRAKISRANITNTLYTRLVGLLKEESVNHLLYIEVGVMSERFIMFGQIDGGAP